MIDAPKAFGRKVFMQRSNVGKQDQHESLCEELLRERAAVLSRAGFAVEDALEKLVKIGQRIEDKIQYFRSYQNDPAVQKSKQSEQALLANINLIIDQFNAARQKAEIQFYYLIVTREALGLRRHETVQKLYQVPPKKKKMQAI